jgi:hypothetical protein
MVSPDTGALYIYRYIYICNCPDTGALYIDIDIGNCPMRGVSALQAPAIP